MKSSGGHHGRRSQGGIRRTFLAMFVGALASTVLVLVAQPAEPAGAAPSFGLLNAKGVSLTFNPNPVACGAPVIATAVFEDDGVLPWLPSRPNHLGLPFLFASIASAPDFDFDLGSLAFSSTTGITFVGETDDFSGTVYAPTSPGTYEYASQLYFASFLPYPLHGGVQTPFGTEVHGTLTVVCGATTTTASDATATFSTADQTVGLSATVTSLAGTVNQGTVTFSLLSGTTTIGTPVSGTVTGGEATAGYLVPGGTPAGTYTIDAVYNPAGSWLGSSDNTHSLIILSPGTS